MENHVFIVGILAGICTSIAALPQLIKAIKTKRVEGLSPFMFGVLVTGLSLWVVYGAVRQDWPLVVTNAVSVGLNLAIFILFFKYRQTK